MQTKQVFVHLDCSRSSLHTSHTAIHIHTHTKSHRDPRSYMTTTSAWGFPFVCLCTKSVIAQCAGKEVGDIFPEVEGIRVVCPPLPNHILNWKFVITGNPLNPSIRAVKGAADFTTKTCGSLQCNGFLSGGLWLTHLPLWRSKTCLTSRHLKKSFFGVICSFTVLQGYRGDEKTDPARQANWAD